MLKLLIFCISMLCICNTSKLNCKAAILPQEVNSAATFSQKEQAAFFNLDVVKSAINGTIPYYSVDNFNNAFTQLQNYAMQNNMYIYYISTLTSANYYGLSYFVLSPAQIDASNLYVQVRSVVVRESEIYINGTLSNYDGVMSDISDSTVIYLYDEYATKAVYDNVLTLLNENNVPYTEVIDTSPVSSALYEVNGIMVQYNACRGSITLPAGCELYAPCSNEGENVYYTGNIIYIDDNGLYRRTLQQASCFNTDFSFYEIKVNSQTENTPTPTPTPTNNCNIVKYSYNNSTDYYYMWDCYRGALYFDFNGYSSTTGLLISLNQNQLYYGKSPFSYKGEQSSYLVNIQLTYSCTIYIMNNVEYTYCFYIPNNSHTYNITFDDSIGLYRLQIDGYNLNIYALGFVDMSANTSPAPTSTPAPTSSVQVSSAPTSTPAAESQAPTGFPDVTDGLSDGGNGYGGLGFNFPFSNTVKQYSSGLFALFGVFPYEMQALIWLLVGAAVLGAIMRRGGD